MKLNLLEHKKVFPPYNDSLEARLKFEGWNNCIDYLTSINIGVTKFKPLDYVNIKALECQGRVTRVIFEYGNQPIYYVRFIIQGECHAVEFFEDELEKVKRQGPSGDRGGHLDDALGYILQAKQFIALTEQQQPVNAEFSEVFGEIEKSVRKFPTWPTDPLHALAVLGEEFGELTKSAMQLTYEPHKTSMEEFKIEARQTAAMALRFFKSIDTYEFTQCDQHEQKAEV